MTGVYIMLGGMVLFATFVCLVDFLDERRERKAQSLNPKP